jgi:hypothetical protein
MAICIFTTLHVQLFLSIIVLVPFSSVQKIDPFIIKVTRLISNKVEIIEVPEQVVDPSCEIQKSTIPDKEIDIFWGDNICSSQLLDTCDSFAESLNILPSFCNQMNGLCCDHPCPFKMLFSYIHEHNKMRSRASTVQDLLENLTPSS